MAGRSGEIAAKFGVGDFEVWTTRLPSSAEEGKADAVAAAGVVLVKKSIC